MIGKNVKKEVREVLRSEREMQKNRSEVSGKKKAKRRGKEKEDILGNPTSSIIHIKKGEVFSYAKAVRRMRKCAKGEGIERERGC